MVCTGVWWNSFLNLILDWRLAALATNLPSNSCSLNKRGEGLEASPTSYLYLSHVVICVKVTLKVCFLQPWIINKLWMKHWKKIFLYLVCQCMWNGGDRHDSGIESYLSFSLKDCTTLLSSLPHGILWAFLNMKDPAESAGQELEIFPTTGHSCLCIAAAFHQKRAAAKRS